MASNLKRSKRTVGKRVNDLSKRVSRLQKNPAPRRIGSHVISEDNLEPGVIIDINAGADVAVDFYSNNNQNDTIPTTPEVSSDGTAITHVINTDSTATITFNWSYTTTETEGVENNIDGYVIYVYQAGTNSVYNFTSSNLETTYFAPREKRSFVLVGVPANKYYTFGIKAYRVVDTNISNTGVLYSAITKSTFAGENPFQPSASVSYTGNIDNVAASVVSTAATNFNANNDQNATVPTAPTINSDETAVDHTLNTDGSANLSFEWNYSPSTTEGAANNIDGFAIYLHVSPTFSISAVVPSSPSAGSVTYTTLTAHGLAIGDTVVISGLLPVEYNGTFTVTAVTSTTFRVANATTATVTDATGFVFGNTTYTFGTAADRETVYYENSEKRALILTGVAANLYYTFGVRAYRSVDSNIGDGSGILYSTTVGGVNAGVVKPTFAGENPYQPSANVVFSGNIGDTLAGSVPASSIYNVTNNFNTNNDQISDTPNTPTSVVLTSSTQSVTATFDLAATWSFNSTGNAGNVDGFVAYLRTIQPIQLDSLSASGSVVTYTTKTNHGFSAGNSVVISGVTPVGYAGTFTVLASPAPTSNTFAVTNATTGTALFTTAQVYSSTAAATDISTSDLTTNIQSAIVTAEVRGYTFTGMPAGSVYKVAVRAYRVVDTNINAAGIIYGALANSGTLSPGAPSLGGSDSIYIGNGKMYIGIGNYANANTGFYVDSGGYFSLKDKLTWDGTTLTLDGNGKLTAGTVQVGTNVGPGYLGITFNGITLNNDYNNCFVKGSDGYTYFNLGIGSPNSLTFNSSSGVLSLTGAVTASSGVIGGWTLAADQIFSDVTVINGLDTEHSVVRIKKNGVIRSDYDFTGIKSSFYERVRINGYAEGNSFAIYVEGTASGSFDWRAYSSSGVIVPSDIRIKNVIDKEVDALSILNKVDTFAFTYKKDTTNKEKYGFSAQQLHEHIKDAVMPSDEDPDKKPWTITNETLIPYMVKAIKQLTVKIEDLEKKMVKYE